MAFAQGTALSVGGLRARMKKRQRLLRDGAGSRETQPRYTQNLGGFKHAPKRQKLLRGRRLPAVGSKAWFSCRPMNPALASLIPCLACRKPCAFAHIPMH